MNKGMLSDTDRRETVLYRIEKAQRAYKEALGCINAGYVETSANRLYYSAYYAVSAYLIANGISVKTHSGVKSMFNLYLIKPGVLEQRFRVVFSQLFSLRMTGDYEDRRNLDMEQDVMPLVEPTKELIEKVSQLAEEKI